MVLQSDKATYSASWYLDSSPGAGKSTSVYLSEKRDFRTHPGCYWLLAAGSGNTIRLKTVSSGSKQYLDSSAAAGRNTQVYLADSSAGGGSHWTPTLQLDGTYSFKSDTPSGNQQYLYANPTGSKDESVYLSSNSDEPNEHWIILLTHYIGESVQSYICDVYPSVPISSCEPNGTYGSLDYDRLHSIWKDTQLGDKQMTPNVSDFAVCLKAEVCKCSNDSDSPWPNDKGRLCGIMWGSIGGKTRALNFTIDPFQNLILFDPQDGQKIANNEFTPTFCMV